MTTTNDETEVLCEDGETRPLSVCTQVANGEWHPTEECVEVHVSRSRTEWRREDDDDVCYLDSRGEWHLRDNCIEVGCRYEHTDDATTCDRCECGVLRDEVCATPDNDEYCAACYRRTVTSCCGCGEDQWSDDNDLDEDGYCESCHPPSIIRGYCDKSANHLRSEYRGKDRYGIELEVEGYESAEEAAEYIRTLLPDSYCTLKRDGSLGEAGVEIVTRPDGMAVHKRMFAQFFKDSPGKQLSSWNTGRCGMHVHISRAALSELQIGKMLCFLNEPAAVNFISKIAGRAPCNWCKVHKKKVSDVGHEHDRYTALNVTGSRTVEVRIFKGTLAEAGFMKNLEFVQALVEFTAPAGRSIAEATSYRAFCEWLPRKAYPHLHQFLVSKGFIRRRKAA